MYGFPPNAVRANKNTQSVTLSYREYSFLSHPNFIDIQNRVRKAHLVFYEGILAEPVSLHLS